MKRLPGGEITGETVHITDDSLALGAELLEAMRRGDDFAEATLGTVAVANRGMFHVETASLAKVVVVPRPNFQLVRQLRHWPAGPIEYIESDQPIGVRTIYPPNPVTRRLNWRIASPVEPSPVYRYQLVDIGARSGEPPVYGGLDLAVIPLAQSQAA